MLYYSDLNRGVMKIPFFALFQLAEKNLWNRFKDRITENDLKIVFGADLAEKIATKRQGAMKSNVDIGWEGVFTFPWILKLARHFGLIHLEEGFVELIECDNPKSSISAIRLSLTCCFY